VFDERNNTGSGSSSNSTSERIEYDGRSLMIVLVVMAFLGVGWGLVWLSIIKVRAVSCARAPCLPRRSRR
jgi:hypothetical protein